MINQTPGFTLDVGDTEQRGFAGAVGNVLIDGQRLGAKSQSLEDVLQRVPATEVLRIEILRGSDVAGDASNAAVLANVVRTRTAGGGTWMAGFEMTNEENPSPTGRLAWSGRNEDREYSIGANTYSHDHNSEGPREVTDGTGTLVARRRGGFPHEQSEHALNGQYSQAVGEGKLVVTGQAFYSRFSEDFWLRTTTPDGAQIEREIDPYNENTRSGEAGVTWQLPLERLGDDADRARDPQTFRERCHLHALRRRRCAGRGVHAGPAPAQRREHRARHVRSRSDRRAPRGGSGSGGEHARRRGGSHERHRRGTRAGRGAQRKPERQGKPRAKPSSAMPGRSTRCGRWIRGSPPKPRT